jgi:adenylate cyclase
MRRMQRVVTDVVHPARDLIGDRAAPPDAPALRRSLERALWLRAGMANLGGAIPLIVLGGEYVRRFTPKYHDLPLFWAGLGMTLFLYLPMWLTFRLFTRNMLRRSTRWIEHGRPPTEEERHLTATLARRAGLFPAPWWLSACVLAVVVIRLLGVVPSASEQVVGVVGIVLGGVVSCGLCYLLAEDALRPLYRLVLATEGSPEGRQVGIRTRLVVYWIVGSGAYLLGIALILANFPPAIARAMGIVCCALGAVVGFIMTNLSAGSLTRPIDRLREAMQRVESGDLTTTVDVDDPGDVGSLQSGFNRMVSGMRERDRLQELFGRHVGAEVARRAVAADAGLAGTDCYVSILFVDVIGSTALAAERSPSSVMETLNALFETVVRTVGAEDGLVNQFQGDGALCVFGAPNELPDHAVRALRAAYALRIDIDRLEQRYPGFGAAIGVSTGRVVAGDIGTEDRHEYTVIGDPVNEASRLCDEAKQRSARVLASKASIDAAGPWARHWVPGGEVALRGRRRPTVVFEPRR